MKDPKVCERGSHLHWKIILILILRIYAASIFRDHENIIKTFLSLEDTLMNEISYLEQGNYARRSMLGTNNCPV